LSGLKSERAVKPVKRFSERVISFFSMTDADLFYSDEKNEPSCIHTGRRRSMRTELNLYLLGEVSRRLGCEPYRITYLLATGKVPEPRLRLGNRRLFTEEDIARIAATLGIENGDNHDK
jgi:hypothetical protein